jgi:hypothetical protein
MKNFLIVCFYLFILGCTNENAIYELQAKNDVINKVLENYSKKKYTYVDFRNDSQIVYLNISESPEKKITARITVLDKTEFSFVDVTIGVPYGFFYYKKKTVMVFGNKASRVFNKISENHYFDYLITQEEYEKKDTYIKKDTNKIPLPPINFEPTVYVYELKKNDFKFIFSDRSLYNPKIIYLDDSTVIEVWKGDTTTFRTIKSTFDSL